MQKGILAKSFVLYWGDHVVEVIFRHIIDDIIGADLKPSQEKTSSDHHCHLYYA
jgi:hypothetical protein